MAWFRLTRLQDGGFLLDLDAGFAPALVARLERFKLRVDATFETLHGWRMLSVRGAPQTEDLDPMSLDSVSAETRAKVAWHGFEGIDLLGPELAPPCGLVLAGDAGVGGGPHPGGLAGDGRELTERTIPAEVGGLVEASVSFTKGCYTGQELVARIDSRGGNVPRPLRLLEIGTDVGVAPGAGIVVDGKTVGEITSAAVDVSACSDSGARHRAPPGGTAGAGDGGGPPGPPCWPRRRPHPAGSGRVPPRRGVRIPATPQPAVAPGGPTMAGWTPMRCWEWPADASVGEIRRAYVALARSTHPDVRATIRRRRADASHQPGLGDPCPTPALGPSSTGGSRIGPTRAQRVPGLPGPASLLGRRQPHRARLG